MKKVRFLFYSGDGVFKNDHIFKEHGAMIDYFNRQGYDAKMVCPSFGQTIDAHEKLRKTIHIKRIKDRSTFLGIYIGLLGYLFTVKKIHILILTHFSPKTFIYMLWYRIFHRGGTIYIKGDFDANRFANNGNGFIKSNNTFVRKIEKIIVSGFLALADLVTVETHKGLELLHQYLPQYKHKIAYMPNGYDERFLRENNLKPSFSAKTNTIVTIGRIGTYQKNTEKLLDILKQVDMKDRHMNIIGQIDPAFQDTLDIYFERFPDLLDRITFTGPIYDRKTLFEYLHEAKLYICTSRFEGFSLVFPEVISQGTYMITTPVSGAEDVTNHGQHGSILEKTEDFVHILEQFINEEKYTQLLCDEIAAYAHKHFTREQNLQKLEALLTSK